MAFEVDLIGLTSPALIVPWRSGVVYCNQTHGTFCYHDSMEGILIPLNFDALPEDSQQTLDYKVRKHFPGGCPGIITREIAEIIQKTLDSAPETMGIRINFERLRESHEAWLHVVIDTDYNECFSGFKGHDAIMTWSNSD